MGHLKAHEVEFIGDDGTRYAFVVTYGMHCFTKDGTEYNIPVIITDGREKQAVCLERYECSKSIRRIIESLDEVRIFQTSGERFFTMDVLNNLTGEVEPYKVCLAFYKENRLLRIHVTSAFFARTGEGSPEQPVEKKGFTVFKIAKDVRRSPKKRSAGPKETRNRRD